MESTKALGKYLWVFEHAASQVRHLPNVEKHYDAACAKWATLGLVLPPSGDQQKRKEFFNFCDSECQKIPSESTPEGNFLIVFAASAAAQVVIDHDMIHMDEESRGKAFKAVNDYVIEQHTIVHGAPTTPLQVNRYLLYPPEPTEAEMLVGRVISYQDHTAQVKKCTVVDCGTSMMRGDWFLVSDGLEETTISNREMYEILGQEIKGGD